MKLSYTSSTLRLAGALTATIGLTAASSLNAALLFQNSFSGQTQGTAVSGEWTQDGSQNTLTATSGLTFPGKITDGLAAQNTGRFAGIEAPFNSPSAPFGGSGQTETLWMSYLVTFDGDGNWGGEALVGITEAGSQYDDGFHVGLIRQKPGTVSETYFGGSIGRPGQDFHFGSDLDPSATTYFVLAKFEWEGAGAYEEVTNGMTASMSVFTDSLPTDEPVAWDVTYTTDKTNPFHNPNASFGDVVVTIGNTPTVITVDEIFVGTEVGDVIAVPEPRTYALAAGLVILGFAAWRRRRV